jgi:hypothetical protein
MRHLCCLQQALLFGQSIHATMQKSSISVDTNFLITKSATSKTDPQLHQTQNKRSHKRFHYENPMVIEKSIHSQNEDPRIEPQTNNIHLPTIV